MSSSIQAIQDHAMTAVTELYFEVMQASQARHITAIDRLTEARVAAQKLAQQTYDGTMREIAKILELSIRSARAKRDAAIAAIQRKFDLDTQPAVSECNAACGLAEQLNQAANETAGAICNLTKDMIDEQYEVALEQLPDNKAPEWETARQAYISALGRADIEFHRTRKSATETYEASIEAAQDKLVIAATPTMEERESAIKLHEDAFAAVTGPAQQLHDEAARQALKTLEANFLAARAEEDTARRVIDLEFAAERRARVFAFNCIKAAIEGLAQSTAACAASEVNED